MVSIKIYFLATILFVSEAYSQLVVAPRACCPATITPTGPIIPVGKCIIPAIIKPLVSPCQCQPMLPCQTLPPCPPVSPCQPLPPCPPTLPIHPGQPENSMPCVEDDDEDTLDKILYLLINNMLDNKKNSGKKSSSDKSADLSNIFVNCGDDYEHSLPPAFPGYPAPAPPCPPGCAGEQGPDACYSIPVCGNGYSPEINVIFRPYSDAC